MDKVINYLNSLKYTPFKKTITVYGWEFNYEHELLSSVMPYLFEPLEIKENIAPSTNDNRDGRKRDKHYIVIHDTGDAASHRDAYYWSNVVKTMNNEGSKYLASFQYVVGSDAIYHNIPDDEIAYHAGDSTKFDYELIKTGVSDSKSDDITISEDGYYCIGSVKSDVQAPSTDTSNITPKINDQGLLLKKVDGYYFLGRTYYNESYKLIANRGGNNNGIGIETCINQGCDVYLNMQRLAKLVAYLMDKYGLLKDDIKQHHYFSGKDCPMTFRKNHLWEHILYLIDVEAQMLKFKKEGYSFELIPESRNILNNGRIINFEHSFKYSIQVTKDDKVITLNY